MDRVISYELELRGVHGMAVGRYDALLRMIAAGAVDPARLIGRTIGARRSRRRARRDGRRSPSAASSVLIP